MMRVLPNLQLKGKVTADPSVANSNFLDDLENAVYQEVYGIRINEKGTFFLIFWDERHLIHVPETLFIIVDSVLPNNFIYKKDEAKEITLYPNLFYEKGFFENFSEWEDKERKEFEILRIEMSSRSMKTVKREHG